ncbi:DUF202 domain-containing protein [Lentibacillus sp. N15]|uniref:YidH family protein n=1 Tax=Lentibacillus songyuanensis TaxID=3136161 RepID=UPI0031BB73C4
MGLKDTKWTKYIQQHLANERTFLVWIRTAIANIIGISSVILGLATIIMATINYMRKINTVNQTFLASKKIVLTLVTFIMIIILVFGLYFLVI